MKKILCTLLTVLFVVSVSAFPASAANEESNAQIAAQATTLEKKFGITITYPIDKKGKAAITLNNLETLDTSLSTLTPAVVKQISKYYMNSNGNKLDFTYVFSNSGYNYQGGILMAAFEKTTSKIYIFLPSESGNSIISGENPVALVHEVGHAFHLMCMDQYGAKKMRTEWTKFNRGYAYQPKGGFDNPSTSVFISGYANTSFEEDFAETFAHTFIRTKAGTGFRSQLSADSQITGLGQKVAYIEKLIPMYLTDTEQAVATFHKIYKTPTSMTFEGQKFSGEYLQYIGYPQPKNILKGILNGLELTSQKSTWIRSLGAWRVVSDNGDTYFIFPGGSWSAAKQSNAQAA